MTDQDDERDAHAAINRAMRQAAAREVSPMGDTLPDDATPAQRAALAAGLPIEAAARLRGETPQELEADALDFASAVGAFRPSDDGPRVGGPGSWGGGQRGGWNTGAPSMNAQIRALARGESISDLRGERTWGPWNG